MRGRAIEFLGVLRSPGFCENSSVGVAGQTENTATNGFVPVSVLRQRLAGLTSGFVWGAELCWHEVLGPPLSMDGGIRVTF
jgi:hypothetical protein